MLNALRRGSKGLAAKLLIALLVFAFAIWGVADFVNTIDPTEVASVGDTPVPAREFDRAYRLQSSRVAQILGRGLSPQEAQAQGVPQGVLQTLVAEAVQIDAARALGVDLSDAALRERITTDPRFSPSGAFDRELFDRYLASLRYSESEFIELERNAAIQELWSNSLLGGVTAPTPYLQAVNRFDNQTRTVEMMVLTDDALGPIVDPTEETLRTFHAENEALFQSPERRTVATVTLSPEVLADPETVSDDAVRAAYEAGNYGSPERRRVQQVILDDPEIAQRAAEAVNEGYAFGVILRQLGKKSDDVDLGLVERSDIANPAVAEAAFTLAEREASVVDGRFGPTLVRVAAIEPATKLLFEEVSGDIRESLALEEATSQVRALRDQVTDAIVGGAPVEEVAERFDLPLARFEEIDRQGTTPSGETIESELRADVLRQAFSKDAGADAVAVEDGRTSVFVQTEAVVPAATRPFDEVRGEVLVAWTEAEKRDRLEAIAEEAVAAVQAGAPLAEVAQRHDAALTTTPPFTATAPPQGVPATVAEAAFSGPRGHTATVPGEDSEQIVLVVTEVAEPAFFEGDAALASTRQQLDEGLANTVLLDLLTAWQTEVGTSINRPVYDQLVGLAPRPAQGGF